MTIKIESGFISALDKCPDCGDEHDVAQQVECRACGHHAGGDLAEEWLGHCEEELKTLPAGVEVIECHEPDCPGDDYTMTFEIADSANMRDVFAFLARLCGGATVTAFDENDDKRELQARHLIETGHEAWQAQARLNSDLHFAPVNLEVL